MQATQLKTIANWLNADYTGDPYNSVTNVQFDSRKVKPGDLFVALKGAHDGHDYIADAFNAGANIVLANKAKKDDLNPDWPIIYVDDTERALWELAKKYKEQFDISVVAITGSNGKTTTKDMVAAILETKYHVTKTPENFNNEIGVPLTLLQINDLTQVLVVELGMDRPGQLTDLSMLVEPDFAVITMIGEAHIEFFKTKENIAKAKLEIINGMKNYGVLSIPANERLLNNPKVDIDKRTFALSDDGVKADIIGKIKEETATMTSFVYRDMEFHIPIIGAYNVNNALAAISIGEEYGIELEDMQRALASFELTAERTEWLTTDNNVKILSDVYNSNPTAVHEVLKALHLVKSPHKYIVLGDMLELGESANDLHAQLADDIIANDYSGVFLIGDIMKEALAPELKDFYQSRLQVYDKAELMQLATDLKNIAEHSDVILLKASHGIHLEKVVHELMKTN